MNINLEKLNVSYNPKITNDNHMTNMKDLVAIGSCGIVDNSIENLNFEKLRAQFNGNITITRQRFLKKLIN